MNLRFLTPGIVALLGLIIGIQSQGNIEVLKDKTFQMFILPFFVIFSGWFIHQGFRFYWTIFGFYHLSIYHNWIRNNTNYLMDDKGYHVDLSKLGLKNLENLSKKEFNTLFDPFKAFSKYLMFLPYPLKRIIFKKKNQLPFVNNLDKFLLNETSLKETPAKRWTDLMISLSSIIAVFVGYVSAWIFNPHITKVSPFQYDLGFDFSTGYGLILIIFLIIPAILQATVISWGEARSYELLAIMVKKSDF